jgi:putative ABC transport system permease protein
MKTLRNVFRRKLRASLTIFGITIGIFAFVVMFSMAEKITQLVNGGTEYFSDKVVISDSPTSGFATNPISVDRIKEFESIEGVRIASADVTTTVEEEAGASFGIPPLVIGSDLRGEPYESFELLYADGRELEADDRGVAVIGSDMIAQLNTSLGETIKVRDRDFEVIGVLEKTLTLPDTSVYISLADAQDLFYEMLPDFIQQSVEKDMLATSITIFPDPGVDPDALATVFKDTYPDFEVVGPKDFEEQVVNSTRIFTWIVIGIAMISLIVGGLSIINTMIMSVFERTREIGIRKSLGASNLRIVLQFLKESALIGLIGGLVGLFFGWLFTVAANAAGSASGIVLFLLTPRVIIWSVLLAVLLGTFSGLFPAIRAARMNPVQALRYE